MTRDEQDWNEVPEWLWMKRASEALNVVQIEELINKLGILPRYGDEPRGDDHGNDGA